MSKLLQNVAKVAVLALPIVALSTQNASAQDRRDFIVYNGNSRTITRLYISPPNLTRWGPNILSGTLPSGYSTTVFFLDQSNRCVYDVMAVYRNNTYDVVQRINLCQTAILNFDGDGGDYAMR